MHNPKKQAEHAVRAAQNRKKWGRWMTATYAKNNGVPSGLLTLALQLEATKHIKELQS